MHAEIIRSHRFGSMCPAGAYHKFDAYYPLGKMYAAVGLLRNKLTWTEGLLNMIYACTECGACTEQCKIVNVLDPVAVIEAMRVEAVREGQGPLPKHKFFAESIEQNHNPYGEPHEKRLDWIPLEVKIPLKAKIMYFTGCTSSYRQTRIAKATVELLNKLGVEFGILGMEEWCCGSPLFRTGQVDPAVETLKHNTAALEEAGAEIVIFTCPGCYRVFKEASLYGAEHNLKLLHITEYLVNELKVKPSFRELKVKAVYHDPCHLGRHLGVYEEPRELLRMVPGLELVEMERNRKFSWCCGAGAGVKSQFPEFASWSASERLEEAKDAGASIIVSACPFCMRGFIDVKNQVGGMEVYDVTEVLLSSLKGEA